MYAGKLVEISPADELLEHPLHPYTVGLMNSFPSIDGQNARLEGIPGAPPDLVRPPGGCRFNPRCPRCVRENAELFQLQTTVQPQLQRNVSGSLGGLSSVLNRNVAESPIGSIPEDLS